LADYVIDNDLYSELFISFFDEHSFCPLPESDNENWCGGVSNNMFALDAKGIIYHCIRFMDSSLQGEQEPISIGDIKNGVGVLPKHVENIEMCSKITRRSQSTDECFYCPIGKGCAWCSGYNYQVFGTPNKRATFICG
jgi:radical SAM protein with 4Fe4S-binding SPASM domain